ncbi:MAG: aldose epimerase family protein [Eubacteriales bacterium]|nr:aldose epimerase family protein [Eubacteriales bacterium]
MKKTFGVLPDGQEASLYTISCGRLTAAVSDYGATLVRLLVPDRAGNLADVVLGHDSCDGYRLGSGCLGATVGRNANRIGGAAFALDGTAYPMEANEGRNNLHSGPDLYFKRLWQVAEHSEDAITLTLRSPHKDQGFPGNADIRVTYALTPDNALHIRYEGICDRDTVFNMTNHSYFNLAGHEHTAAAMDQLLTLPGRFFTPDDAESIPTGELRKVDGTPMDFRTPKPIARDIEADYEPLHLQGGYDHNWEVFCNPCAMLTDPVSGRSLAVTTDCPGVQFYAGNFLDETGKDGVHYGRRSGVALETQFYPDALHHPTWPQPITRAGEKYKSETVFRFSW